MKAMVYKKYGPPNVLHLKDMEKPIPTDNEVLVRVRAASVNRTDCANLTAKPFIMRFVVGFLGPKKVITGTEFAGEVEAVGTKVTAFKPGDAVFGFDDMGLQSHAEYLVIDQDASLAIKPAAISYEQAAGCIEGAHYAINLINKVPMREGAQTLVIGASGGIGSATVQLLRHFGAIITGVCPTESVELARSLGCQHVFDYRREDFTHSSGSYDFIFDAVGKSTFGRCKPLLKRGGVYISSELGPGGENIFYSLATALWGSVPGNSGKKVKFPYPDNKKGSVLLVKKLIESGEFKPVIDRTYPLAQVPDAFRYVMKGIKVGNVVITIP